MIFHQEREDVAAFTAAKTMEGLPVRIDDKRGGFFGMKGTAPLEVGAGPLESDMLTNDVDNLGRILDESDRILLGGGDRHCRLSLQIILSVDITIPKAAATSQEVCRPVMLIPELQCPYRPDISARNLSPDERLYISGSKVV